MPWNSVNSLPRRDTWDLFCLSEVAENIRKEDLRVQVFDFETKDIHGSQMLCAW